MLNQTIPSGVVCLYAHWHKLGALFRKGDEERRKARFHKIPLQPSTRTIRQGEMSVVVEGVNERFVSAKQGMPSPRADQVERFLGVSEGDREKE